MRHPMLEMRVGLAVLCLCFTACPGPEQPPKQCVPGRSVACVGPGGCAGGQVCREDGKGYEACVCGTAPQQDAGTNPGGPDGGGTSSDGGQMPPDGGPPNGTPDAGTSSDAGTTVGVGPGGFLLDGGGLSGGSNVVVDPNGHLILGTGIAELTFAWLANNDQNTVSKFDTRTGREVARYFAVIPVDGLPNPNGGIGNPNGLRGNASNNPSRTAVDLLGDVWIANRAVSPQGSVTKIASTLAGCRERNGVPGIQTSRDLNGDGAISTNAADGEMIIPTDWSDAAQYDECILHSTPLGTATASTVKARAQRTRWGTWAIPRGGGDRLPGSR